MAENVRYIVAVDREGNNREWSQSDMRGTREEAEAYLDRLKTEMELPDSEEAQDPTQQRLVTALTVFAVMANAGWDTPQVDALVSSVGSAIHLICETLPGDRIIVDLREMTVGVQRGPSGTA